jgi:hypothetical protein
MTKLEGPPARIVFAIPVLADYRELEPVLARALAKRAQRPFVLPAIGSVSVVFERVVMYGATGGRLAVGLTFQAWRDRRSPAHGTIWLTARPVTSPDSRQVAFADLAVAGATDSTGTDLLLQLANAPALSATIADALTQNFSNDYDKLLVKIGNAIAERRQGDLLIRARVDDVGTGRILATGQGLYLPVSGRGSASITVRR